MRRLPSLSLARLFPRPILVGVDPVPRSLFRATAAAFVLAAAAIALSGCTQAPAAACCRRLRRHHLEGAAQRRLGQRLAAKFSAADVPSIFQIPASPAPTCYYSTVVPPSPQSTIAYVETHRTLLYIGLSDSDAKCHHRVDQEDGLGQALDGPLRLRQARPERDAGRHRDTDDHRPRSTTSARWYYNFAGAATEDKGQLGYYLSEPISQGTALQAGIQKPVNVLRVETELRQLKK